MVTSTTKFTDPSDNIDNNLEYKRFKGFQEWSNDQEHSENQIHILHLNIRSLRKHFNEFTVLLDQNRNAIDIIILTEINIKSEEISFYAIKGYDICDNTRKTQRGGGVIIYYKKHLQMDLESLKTTACEGVKGKLIYNKRVLHIIALYRPPQMNKILFLDQLRIILQEVPSSEDLIVIGDVNIDLFRPKNRSYVSSYKNTLCEQGLFSAIPDTEITRQAIVEERVDESCIDHLWVRVRQRGLGMHAAPATAFVIESGMSDHHIIGIALNLNNKRTCDEKCSVRKLVIDEKLVRDKLTTYDWSQLLSIMCPIMLYQQLFNVFNSIYEQCKFEKSVSHKRETQPWVTRDLYKMLVKRDTLFRAWKMSPHIMNKRLEYTKFRNRVNKLINAAKNKHRKSEILNCKGDYRKIWSNINNWLGRVKSSLDSIIIKYLGKTENVYNICCEFTKTFTKEILTIKHVCNIKFLDRRSYVTKNNVSFRYVKVAPHDIEKIINTLSSKKAPGLDNIRVQDLKLIKNQISPVLANFINLSLSSGLYPDLLKKAIIRPIYKTGSHYDYTNYRPIAILSVINKIVEKVIVGQVSMFLERHNLLTDHQHGFRRGRSTVTALTHFSEVINESLNSGKQVLCLFIDYKKAFDTLDHNVLVQAMEECGIGGPANAWFKNYLTNRAIQTAIEGTKGAEARVTLGVPTGSVYGPVGYIMFVNSVVNVVQKCKVFMYADDMCLFYASNNMEEARCQLQNDFENIIKWAHDNGIIINVKKTKCLHIYSPYNRIAKTVDYTQIGIVGHTYDCLHRNKLDCDCAFLDYVDRCKYLGLLVDHNFNFKFHVEELCRKLRIVLGKIYQLKKVVSKEVLLVVYYALADSLISYGLTVYGRTFSTYIKDIGNLQTGLVKYLVDSKTKNMYNDYSKLFPVCKILPVEVKIRYLISLENYYLDEYKCPVYNRYNTRRVREGKFIQPPVVNYYGKRLNKYLVPRLFNDIGWLRDKPKLNKSVLKRRLKAYLLENI